jgi:hypothetical protein
MDKADRQKGSQEAEGSREPQRASRPAPGKLTRTSRLSAARGTVQRKAASAAPADTSPPSRSSWDLTMDPWMDAAHRGLTALVERPQGQVQAHGDVDVEDPAAVHRAAAAGVSGSGSALPHLGRIQESLGGNHDLSQIRAHVGGEAATASAQMGAQAYATGNHIAFKSQPDLHTAAHEAAHVVQQRAGVQLRDGVGKAGDTYERQADDVADRVVQGRSASDLLGNGGGGAAVQKKDLVQRSTEAVVQFELGTTGGARPQAGSLGQPSGTDQTSTEAQPAAFQPVSVPPVVGIARILDPVARNHAINQSYHQFDTSMTQYLGQPLVSNWCTYGQHASHEAGSQIANLQAAIDTLDDVLAILISIPSSANPIVTVQNAMRAAEAIRRVVVLLNQPGIVKQSIQLALAKAGITPRDLQKVADAFNAVTTFEWTDLIPGAPQAELVVLAVRTLDVAASLAAAIPAIIAALGKIHRNMISGNRQIYENIAPAYHLFLSTANGAPQGVPGAIGFAGDGKGFLAAAFQEYAHVRRVTNELAALAPNAPARPAKIADRNQRAHRANLLIGFQEQLVILQPIFDTMQEELRAMSGTMVLRDPNGVRALAPNWGDFYTRMGIDPSTAPADPNSITPSTLPPMRNSSDPRNAGTINEYFSQGLNNQRIHDAPRPISRL